MSGIISLTEKNKLSTGEAILPKEGEISSSSPQHSPCPKEEMSCEDEEEYTVMQLEHSRTVTHSGDVNAEKHSTLSDAEGEASGRGEKELSNGHKSKNLTTGSTRRPEDTVRRQKSISSGSVKSSAREISDSVDILASGGSKDGVLKRNGGLKSPSAAKLRSNSDVMREKKEIKEKKLLKNNIHVEGANDLGKESKGTLKDRDMDNNACGKIKRQLGHGKHSLVAEGSNPAKRSKSADVAVDSMKGSLQRNRKSGVLGVKSGDSELKRSTSQGKPDNCLAPRVTKGGFDSDSPGDEDVLPPSKRRRPDVVSGSISAPDIKKGKNYLVSSDKVKSSVDHLPKKRRAVRLYDDDEDEVTKTPVHGGSIRKADVHSRASDSTKNISSHTEQSTHEQALGEPGGGASSTVVVSTVKVLNESSSPCSHQHVEILTKASTIHPFSSPGMKESEKMSSDDAKPVLASPIRSPLLPSVAKPIGDDVAKPVAEPSIANKPFIRASSNSSQRNSPGANRNSIVVSDYLDHSQNQRRNERGKSVLSSDKQKNTQKSSSRTNDSVVAAAKPLESNLLTNER